MKRIHDHYTKKAKAMGYPARSVFKLEEINNKFKIFSGGPVLDIGAAPGSWSLYCLKNKKGPVVGVDLQEMNIRDPGFTFFKGDICTGDIRSKIASMGPYPTVISDAAPSTTGNRLVDSARSYSLVESIISLAFEVLRPGGSFVCKIFQGGDEKELLDLLSRRFRIVKTFKPKASRNESFEVFFIASDYISPVL